MSYKGAKRLYFKGNNKTNRKWNHIEVKYKH